MRPSSGFEMPRRWRALAASTAALVLAWGSSNPSWASPPTEEAGDASPAPEDAPTPEAEAKARAKAEVAAASQAFAAGDLALAIEHYEAAMAILPAPKLHYNIGVCHQRLALKAETPAERTRHRDLAIDSYNRYLEQNPRAGDRLEVAETIRDLGGTPANRTLVPLFEDEGEVEGTTTSDEEAEDSDSPKEGGTPSEDANEVEDTDPVEPPKPPPYPHHGRVGAMLLGGTSPTIAAAAAIDARGMIAFELHGGGFVGARRRFLLAAHTLLFTGAPLVTDGYSHYGWSLGLLGEQTWVLGRESVQLGVGALAALTGQGLNQRQDVPPPICSIDRGPQFAARSGALLSPRVDLGVLLGARRRGMISLLVQPSFSILGDGPKGDQCQAGITPWTNLGVRRRWQFTLWAGAGFSYRF